jgi:hypothetical protein
LKPWDHMGINIERHLDTAMAEPLLNDLGVYALL